MRNKVFMAIDDRTLCRLHIEAVWDIQLPPIIQNAVEIQSSSNQPPWLLYIAQVANERISIWRANVDSSTRQSLLQQAEDALAHSRQPDEMGIEREIALKFTGQSRMTLAQAQRLAQPIVEQNVVEAFQPGAAQYFFERGREPLFGTIRDGRLLSIAHSSRRTPEVCELGIETLPEARRQGYALAATILWTHAVLRENLVPIYSALAQNTASLALAAAAGYRIFARGINITNLP
jgi:RimJ/RimL family protein N-acetyltransferase